MIVYLAGGINGLSDSDAKDWREYSKENLSATTLDPMRRDYRGIEDQSVNEIVRGDIDDILKCDVVLASCVRPSWGTAMEIHFAGDKGIPVIAVVPDGNISPWLRYFSDRVVRSFDEAIDILNAES